MYSPDTRTSVPVIATPSVARARKIVCALPSGGASAYSVHVIRPVPSVEHDEVEALKPASVSSGSRPCALTCVASYGARTPVPASCTSSGTVSTSGVVWHSAARVSMHVTE
jgi:hypothetical protein